MCPAEESQRTGTVQELPELVFSWWASKGFPHPSRASVLGKLVLDSLKINRITPTPPPALPSKQKASFCLACLEHHNRRSRSDPHRDPTRHLMHSFSSWCTVPSLLQPHRIMAVRRQHKTQLASTPHKTPPLTTWTTFVSKSLPLFFCKRTPFHTTRVKLLSYSFSSNTVQPSRFFYLIQSTKNPLLLLFFSKTRYWHPEYTINKWKYTNKPK